jgi:hypothetical protein
MTASLKIIFICILAAISYGIVHDQITARICIEYFTIGHPPVFGTENPTLLGLGWGVIATWWMGLGLGIPLSVVCRSGNRRKIEPYEMIKPIAELLLIMAIMAISCGVAGWLLANSDLVQLQGDISLRIPKNRHVLFLADAFAHSASYAVGFFGGLIVIARTWKKRKVSESQST